MLGLAAAKPVKANPETSIACQYLYSNLMRKSVINFIKRIKINHHSILYLMQAGLMAMTKRLPMDGIPNHYADWENR